ncbi:hypothetical protein VNO77_26747 [Canavalia gladiata]|uniref:Uncharacterized protein n=1 Tax=Canavalia gladiata TaxID=3824 RepID=A0AAN9Q5V8_CANGL
MTRGFGHPWVVETCGKRVSHGQRSDSTSNGDSSLLLPWPIWMRVPPPPHSPKAIRLTSKPMLYLLLGPLKTIWDEGEVGSEFQIPLTRSRMFVNTPLHFCGKDAQEACVSGIY